MTPIKYAKSKIAAGQFANMAIEAGEFGTFWLCDDNYKMLDCGAFLSRDAAEKARSKVIDKAMKANCK